MSSASMTQVSRRAALQSAALGTLFAATAAKATNDDVTTPLDRANYPFLKNKLYLDSAHRAAAGWHLREGSAIWVDDEFQSGGDIEYTDAALDRARQKIASCLGARPDDLAFIRSCIRGVNAAVNALRLPPGSTVLLPENEYIGLEHVANNLHSRGYSLRRIETDAFGRMSMSSLRDAMSSRPSAMIFSWVNNTTGIKVDIDEIGKICRSGGVFTICDAMQAVGFQDRPLSTLPVDVASSGVHKGLLGVPGVGILWVNPISVDRLNPVEAGKESFIDPGITFAPNARMFEYGNQNLIGIEISALACNIMREAGLAKISSHIANLSTNLLESLSQQGWKIATPSSKEERCHIVSIDVGKNVALIATNLEKQNIRLTRHPGRLRFSVGGYTAPFEIAEAMKALEPLRGLR